MNSQNVYKSYIGFSNTTHIVQSYAQSIAHKSMLQGSVATLLHRTEFTLNLGQNIQAAGPRNSQRA